MGDVYPRVTVAAVQLASVFLDREASVDTACWLIREVGCPGARVIGFPERSIPGHPLWYPFHPAAGSTSRQYATRLFATVVVPSETSDALGDAARQAGASVVEVCEKVAGTTGTMHNSLVFFEPEGRILGVPRKLTPTVGERLVHAGRPGASLRAYDRLCGRVSGLICGENSPWPAGRPCPARACSPAPTGGPEGGETEGVRRAATRDEPGSRIACTAGVGLREDR